MKVEGTTRFKIILSHIPDYHPEPEPKPVCTHSQNCRDCPYPRHGFLCWGSDGSCLRSRMNEIIGKEEKSNDPGNSQ